MANPRRPLIWSPDARADLTDIWNYYSHVAGPHTANNVVRRISEACSLLEDHPYAGRSRNEVRPGLRSVVATPHVVFYRVVADEVEIVRVIDGRRDIDQIFADGETM
jgi:toxin ParE1/3/4